ncbi:MAG: NGG1p interacting factor NIF3 [Thiomicrospira sp.]|uniref:NGG1p interacting factor NIF3 n=1 Tax=Thiomicrospira sp. TaxID=935 RepID=UPI001A039CD6|nr:NGG1p interacting factor NIF3 [Thiomicrospira sp.]MBE0493868.1 NGG1p interacting factor NIF3 [Thiomicrospira sp.]
MFKLIFFVPESGLEVVKSAVFEAGAGRQGDYDQCAWQTKGEGQFRPLKGSQPYIGELNQLERVAEYRVETLVDAECLQKVILALKLAHPYEEPAYEVMRLETI